MPKDLLIPLKLSILPAIKPKDLLIPFKLPVLLASKLNNKIKSLIKLNETLKAT
jgi:hypothetical protein